MKESNNSMKLQRINLKHYKTKPCLYDYKHNTIICKYYHSENEKRRSYLKYQYTKELCNVPGCKNDNCSFSYNTIE